MLQMSSQRSALRWGAWPAGGPHHARAADSCPEPFTSAPSKTESLGIPVRQCALSPVCLWWWALGVGWKTHTKWQNKNVQFPGPGDYKQKQNKTTAAAKDLWEVRPVQVLKADFLRLDKPSKGLFLEKTVFLTLRPLSACGSSSRVDF